MTAERRIPTGLDAETYAIGYIEQRLTLLVDEALRAGFQQGGPSPFHREQGRRIAQRLVSEAVEAASRDILAVAREVDADKPVDPRWQTSSWTDG
jgi:hypothetical protein